MDLSASRRTAALAVLAGLAAPALAQTYTESQTLSASDGVPQNVFGGALAVAGDRLVVGAQGDDAGPLVLSGAAYVFVREASGWTQEAKLVASDPFHSATFGGSLDVQGSTAVVGARGARTAGVPTGAGYVFERGAGGWAQTARLLPAATAPYLEFGASVALDGDVLAIGSRGLPSPSAYDFSGAVHVFERGPSGWVESALLVAADAAVGAEFGRAVALQGDRLLIGAKRADGRGAAYVFERDPSGWTQRAKLTAPDGLPDDLFGLNVALEDDVAVVAAPFCDTPVVKSGAAYVYRRSTSGVWGFEAKLQPASPQPYATHAGDVAILGSDRVALTATSEQTTYVFGRVPGTAQWTELARLVATDALLDSFGMKLATEDGRVFAGSSGNNETPGSVFVYEPKAVADVAELSVAFGGSQNVAVEAGPGYGNDAYLVLGSLTGTAPGLQLGNVQVPLNVDIYTLMTFLAPNAPPLGNSFGLLTDFGAAVASFSLPPAAPPALVGLQVAHAYLVIETAPQARVRAASNPVLLDFLP